MVQAGAGLGPGPQGEQTMTQGKRLLRRTRALATASAVAALALGGCANMAWPGAGPGGGQVQSHPVETELRLARAARAAGDYASAVNLYRTVLETRPDDSRLRVELGQTHLEIGDVDGAIAAFERVGPDAPARLDAVIGLAHARFGLHQPEKAMAYLDQAARIAPDDPRVTLGRGVALDLMKRHGEAQALYRAVLDADPQHVGARNNLALSLALTGQYKESVDIMTRLVRSSRATPRIRQNLALIYGLRGDVQQAAAMSRMDLNESDTAANLRLFSLLRDGD